VEKPFPLSLFLSTDIQFAHELHDTCILNSYLATHHLTRNLCEFLFHIILFTEKSVTELTLISYIVTFS
jgi:hypothetical protein